MKNVIGYIRVSSVEQAQGGHSLDAQRAKLEQYASLYDLNLVEVIVDAGVSAKSLDRPGLLAVLAGLNEGRAEGVLITKLDRISRNVKDMAALIEGYFSGRFSLLSVGDQIDTSTAGGRLVINVLMSVATWEREAIGERTSAALRHKIANGEHVGAPKLGSKVENGKLVANEAEAIILVRIRELRAEGHTLRTIAEVLGAEGFKTKRGGTVWNSGTLSRYVRDMEAS